ncbi:FtsW/RodA/SpoVE family cell cycle protein, partial [Intestinimonas massiliensis]
FRALYYATVDEAGTPKHIVGSIIGIASLIGFLPSDLVFGMLAEEWGLVIAALAVLSIVTLAVFAVRACRAGRSSFYTIAACAAASLMVFQTCLNVFGSV